MNALQAPGYSSAPYLYSIGYVPGAGGTMWPGSGVFTGGAFASPPGGIGLPGLGQGSYGNLMPNMLRNYPGLRRMMTPEEWAQNVTFAGPVAAYGNAMFPQSPADTSYANYVANYRPAYVPDMNWAGSMGLMGAGAVAPGDIEGMARGGGGISHVGASGPTTSPV